jgi:hypothetical protein
LLLFLPVIVAAARSTAEAVVVTIAVAITVAIAVARGLAIVATVIRGLSHYDKSGSNQAEVQLARTEH